MNCNDAAEFVSALCDGETIPAPAAEHIGGCSVCRARLQQYLAVGAEMRRTASLEPEDQVRAGQWASRSRTASGLWTKGWESMRIPRFAFALLLILVVVLGSSLVVVRAKARTEGAVLHLTSTLPDGQSVQCFLSLTDKKWSTCARLSPPRYLLSVNLLSRDADRIELGIRQRFNSGPFGPEAYSPTLDDLQRLPQKAYWFRPGEELKIDIPGTGSLVLQGELTDHIPAFAYAGDVTMDPEANQLRVTSPVLVRGKQVVFDFEGANSIAKDVELVQIYSPGQGLWVLSLLPFKGAVEADVDLSRVKFEMNGEPYTFLMAAPVCRNSHIWVWHDPNYKPSDPNLQKGFMGPATMDGLAARLELQK
jgi:hypothetical protein